MIIVTSDETVARTGNNIIFKTKKIIEVIINRE